MSSTVDLPAFLPAPLAVLSSGEATSVWELPGTVRAGFPSPAEDLGAQRIDLLARLIKHPQATFIMRARGDSMVEAGIADGDVLVVDRAVSHRHGHIVIAVVDGEFVCKTLWSRGGRLRLKAANVGYPDITPRDGQTVEVWGVVTAIVKLPPV